MLLRSHRTNLPRSTARPPVSSWPQPRQPLHFSKCLIPRSSFHTHSVRFAGHSHFRNIVHRKTAQDAKKCLANAKIAAQISSAVKVGGGPNPASNSRLAEVLQRAKQLNFPKDKIEDAIQKAVSRNYAGEVLIYEVYGPEGSAMLIEALTDNRNRTAQHLRIALRDKGNMATPGSVKHIFNRKAVVSFGAGKLTEEEVMEVGLQANADDVQVTDKLAEILIPLESLTTAREAIAGRGLTISKESLVELPTQTVELSEAALEIFSQLNEALDNIDEVTNITHNVTNEA